MSTYKTEDEKLEALTNKLVKLYKEFDLDLENEFLSDDELQTRPEGKVKSFGRALCWKIVGGKLRLVRC